MISLNGSPLKFFKKEMKALNSYRNPESHNQSFISYYILSSQSFFLPTAPLLLRFISFRLLIHRPKNKGRKQQLHDNLRKCGKKFLMQYHVKISCNKFDTVESFSAKSTTRTFIS